MFIHNIHLLRDKYMSYGKSARIKSTLLSGMSFISSKQSPCNNLIICITPLFLLCKSCHCASHHVVLARLFECQSHLSYQPRHYSNPQLISSTTVYSFAHHSYSAGSISFHCPSIYILLLFFSNLFTYKMSPSLNGLSA